MAETVGRAEIDVDIDGRGLEAQVRALGQQIGRTLGRSLAQTFGRQMRQLSSDLQRSLDGIANQFGNLDKSLNNTDLELRDVNRQLALFDGQAKSTSKELDKMTREVDRNSSSWRQLPHGLRQVITYTALFAAMGDEIAVLGSAAGSSLTVIASALTAVGAGATIAAFGFAGLFQEGQELTEAAQGVKDAFGGLGDVFGDLQTTIVASMFGPQVQGAVEALAGAVVRLQEPIGAFAKVVGDSLAEVFNALASDESIATFSALLEGFAPIFSTLVSAAVLFGEAIGNVFELSLPFVQIFAEWVKQIADQFLNFTIQNADAITEWFQNGLTIMQALGPLVAAVAQALNALVTPETVAMTVDFIEGLAQFAPVLGNILSVIGELNILNLVVDILNAIGTALGPVIPALQDMAAVISDSLSYAIQTLAPIVADLFIALAPLLPIVAQLASTLLVMGLEAIVPLAQVIIEQLIPALIPLFEALVPLIPAFVEIATVIGQNLAQAVIALMPVVIPLIDLMVQLLLALQPIIPVILLLIQSALGPLIAIVQVAASFIGILIAAVVAVIQPFVDMGRQILDSVGGIEGLNDIINDSISFFEDWGAAVGDVIAGVIDWIEDALGWFADLFGASAKAPSPGGGGGGGGGGGFAAGGIVSGGAYRLTGEAGPEAIVPLNRPLNQVSPDVRELSRIAQGLGGQGGGTGKVVNVQPGAIVVQTVAAPLQVASAVVDRLVANAAI